MTAGHWDDNENDVIVESYFSMLNDELSGRPYNKAANNRELQEKTGRSRGSIEFKLSNVTAACVGLGLPTIQGYRARFNFQMSLAESVARWIAQNPDWETALNKQQSVGFADAGSLFVGVAPTLRNSPPPEETEQIERVAHRFDVAGRDDRNRALGHAGEEVVFHYERATLRQSGRNDLAKREDMLDHVYTAPGRRNPKIPQGAWEKYLAQFTVRAAASPKTSRQLQSKAAGQ